MNKSKVIKNLRKSKGITLIALVITIIVLLILAGVTINAIVGNESAMEKAKQARTENEKGNELDTIKLAVVDAMAKSGDGTVHLDKLNESLSGLVNGEATGDSPWTVTGNTGYKYRITSAGEVTLKGENTLNIGDDINYTTTLNGVTLDEWKVFYLDGDYTYIILSDYLPYNAIGSITGLDKGNTGTNTDYCVKGTGNRANLINAMTNKDNWKGLLTGTLNGNSIDYRTSTDENIKAMGSPTLELYVNSWNAKYSSNSIYTAQTASAMSDGYNGYYVSTTNNPPTTSEYSVNMSSTTGYQDALYYPHTSQLNSTFGYWLASPSAYIGYGVMHVYCSGDVSLTGYNATEYAFRPVVCLSSNILQ